MSCSSTSEVFPFAWNVVYRDSTERPAVRIVHDDDLEKLGPGWEIWTTHQHRYEAVPQKREAEEHLSRQLCLA